MFDQYFKAIQKKRCKVQERKKNFRLTNNLLINSKNKQMNKKY